MSKQKDAQETIDANLDTAEATDDKKVEAVSEADKARAKFQEATGEKPSESSEAEKELKIKLDETEEAETDDKKPEEQQEEEIIDINARLKEAGFESVEDLFEKHQKLDGDHSKLRDDSATKFDFLNAIEAQDPELANEIYGMLIKAQMKQKGIPFEEKKPAETEPPRKSKYVQTLMNTTNPKTEKPYTETEALDAQNLFTSYLDDLGYSKKGDIDEGFKTYGLEQETKAAIKDAGKSTIAFRKNWEPKTKAMGLDWDKDVSNGMAKYFQELGVKDTDFHVFTPGNLAKAFNYFITSKEGGMEMLLKNAAATKTATKKEKKGSGKLLPKSDTSRATSISDNPLDDIKKLPAKERPKALRDLYSRMLKEKEKAKLTHMR